MRLPTLDFTVKENLTNREIMAVPEKKSTQLDNIELRTVLYIPTWLSRSQYAFSF